MELLLKILYFYILTYTLYYLVLAIRNLNDKKFLIQSKYTSHNYQNNFCVIIYSHNNEATLGNLITQLKNQDYPQDNFSVYVILDNCSDNSEKLFYGDNFAQVFNIKDQETVGKDQAISILLEKLSAMQNCNAYVFLDASRYIDTDFMSSVNSALMDDAVISGATVLIPMEMNLRKKIKYVFHKYYTNFILKARSLMGFANIIDSDVLIMRQDLVEKIGCIDFQSINTELKYSLLLAKIKNKCTFNPNIKTFINIDDFSLRIPSFTTRLALFKNCFGQTFSKNFSFNEYVYSLLAPNVLVVLLTYIYLLKHSYKYYFIVDFSIVLLSFATFILSFALSLVSSKMTSKEFSYLFLYPFYLIAHIVRNFPICRNIRKNINAKKELEKNTERMELNVNVTDGKNNIPCKLELISENGLAKVKFLFKKKKFTTASHLRMVDAISELVQKLSEYGFTIKICQCCSNFSPSIDGSTNMIKGHCNKIFSAQQNGLIPTLLWNSCKAFEKNNVVSFIEEIAQ